MVKLTRGERFKQIREERGFKTQQDVTDACGVQKSMLSALENDESTRDVGFSHIVKLAKLYDVSLDWLFGLSECKTANAKMQDVSKFIGLSDSAIDRIRANTLPEFKGDDNVKMLLEVLFSGDSGFWTFILGLKNYMNAVAADRICDVSYIRLYNKEAEAKGVLFSDGVSKDEEDAIEAAAECEYFKNLDLLSKDETIPLAIRSQLLLRKIIDKTSTPGMCFDGGVEAIAAVVANEGFSVLLRRLKEIEEAQWQTFAK